MVNRETDDGTGRAFPKLACDRLNNNVRAWRNWQTRQI